MSTNNAEYTHLRYGFSRARAPHSSHSCLEIHASTLFAIYFAYTAAPVNTECFRFGCAYPQPRPQKPTITLMDFAMWLVSPFRITEQYCSRISFSSREDSPGNMLVPPESRMFL